MAVTQTLLTNGGDETDASSYDTASIAPSANKLVLLSVFNNKAATATLPTVTGASMTWVQVSTQLSSANNLRITVFRGLSATPGTGALTMDYGGTTQLRSRWIVSEFGNVDTSGTNGSGAIVQAVPGADVGAPDLFSLTITLAAFGDVDNATWGTVMVSGGTTVIDPGTGFTEIADDALPGPVQSQWKATNDTTVDWSWTDASSDAIGVAVEIKEGSAAAATNFLTLLGVGT